MSFLKQIQDKVSGLLNKSQGNENRFKRVYNYMDAQSLGILFKFKDETQYNTVKQYIKFVKETHDIKEVFALCFFDGKEQPEFIKSRVDFDFFVRKEINWQQKISNSAVVNFIEKSYHILIDITDGEDPVTNKILSDSYASFKIGKVGSKNEGSYDLMIDMKTDESLKKYLEQINHYLTIINRSK